jgi:hypothetical protein
MNFLFEASYVDHFVPNIFFSSIVWGCFSKSKMPFSSLQWPLDLTLPFFTQEGEVTHVDPGLPQPVEKRFLKRNFLLF